MKLVIKPKEEDDRDGRKGRRLTGNDYRYLLTTRNGEEIDVSASLVSVHLSMSSKSANRANMAFLLDDVEVDADFLAAMEAHIERKDAEDEADADVRRCLEPGCVLEVGHSGAHEDSDATMFKDGSPDQRVD